MTPVAVIGMACRLPNGIDSPDKFWDALLRGDDLVTEVPTDRWDAEDYYDPERGMPGRPGSQPLHRSHQWVTQAAFRLRRLPAPIGIS